MGKKLIKLRNPLVKIFIVVSMLNALSVFAQELHWAKQAFGIDESQGYDIVVDVLGNSYVTGKFYASTTFGAGEINETTLISDDGSGDIFVAKYNISGNLLWVKQAGGQVVDEGGGIAVDNFGNSYVTGSFSLAAIFGPGESNETTLTSSDATDVFIAKYDVSGNLLWVEQAGGANSDHSNGVANDPAGNSYIAGTFFDSITFGLGETNETILTSAGSADIFLAKYDANGDMLWAKQAGGLFIDQAWSVALDGSGSCYVSGGFSDSATFGQGETNETMLISNGSGDIFIAKYDINGSLLWVKWAGGTGNDYGISIVVDSSGDICLTGTFTTSGTFGQGEANETILNGAGSNDVFIAKYENVGNLLWVKWAGGTDNDYGNNIAVGSSGDIYLTGVVSVPATFGSGEVNETILMGAGSIDIFISRYAASGDLLWVKYAGGNGVDEAFGIDVDGSENIYVTGLFEGSATATFGPGEANEVILTGDEDEILFVAKFGSANGTISGEVSANSTGVAGVTVKLLDNDDPTIVIDDLTSDLLGQYTFIDVPSGTYQVMIVQPLGYLVNQNFVFTSLTPGATEVVNFLLSEITIVNDARPVGYWKHQFDVYVRNKGNAQESETNLQEYIDEVANRYNPYFNILLTATDGIDDFENWQSILSVKGNAEMGEKAKAQLAALLLNMMSNKISQNEVVTADNKTAGDVLTFVSELVEDTDISNDQLAMDLAKQANTQQTIPSGLVNNSQNILYKNRAIEDRGTQNTSLPKSFTLYQNHPNPFNPETNIRFDLPSKAKVKLVIYDTQGKSVRTLVDRELMAGEYTVVWDGKNDTGDILPSGVYLFRLTKGDFMEAKKMAFVK